MLCLTVCVCTVCVCKGYQAGQVSSIVIFPHIWWQRWDWNSIHQKIHPSGSEKDSTFNRLQTFTVFLWSLLFCVSLYLCVFFLLQVFSSSGVWQTHWESMAGKGSKKLHHSTEDTQEGSGERVDEIRTVVELMLNNQSRRDEENRDYRVEAERRDEARLIAAENRAEVRRRAEKIAEEERAEARAEAKAKRRREEAKMAEEAEKVKEEVARVASERLREQQEAAGLRAYEQQVALIEMQAKIGERAAEAQRLEMMSSRKRDRAVAGIPNYRDPEDIEDFLQTSERKLRAGEVPEGEWLAILAAKLSGKVGSTWQDLCVAGGDYQDVRCGFLKVCGYTPKLAGEAFYGFKAESTRGMSADQVYHRGAQLLRRMVAPLKLSAEMEFSMLKPWVWSVVGRRARLILDARVVSTAGELIGALQDYLVTEGERTEGQAAVFRKHYQGLEKEEGKKGGGTITCFKCGKVGHKAVDCRQKGGAAPPSSYKAASPPVTSYKLICYNCGEEGHKSTSCHKEKKVNPKEGVAKPVRQLWLRDSTDTVLEGVVNGKKASILLDSGASISIVPEVMVGEELKTGESVLVRPFQSKSPMKLPTARVRFQVESLEWEELVALAPVEKGKESEVLYGLDLKSERGLDLVIRANKLGQAGVLRVTTRSEGRQETSTREENAEVVAREEPLVKAVVEAVSEVAEAAVLVGKESAGEGGSVADRPAGTPKPAFSEVVVMGSEKSTGKGDPVVDRLAGDPEPVTQDEAIGLGEDRLPDLIALAEEEEEADLGEGAEYCIREKSDGLENLGIPPVGLGSSSRLELVSELKRDPTLASWTELADKGEQGFSWDRDLLYQSRTTHTLELVHLMVLPESFRRKVLIMAHERSGHLGSRKVKALIKQRFVWPGMGQQVIAHTRSCEVCQRCSKVKARKVPLIEREVLSEPFEVLAFDLVGPFPKGKGGYQYVLTAICMSSRWPEAIPLKSITARAVATGMVEIFSRTGIPLQLLTDQGSQFLGSLVTHLCHDLHIDKVRTVPYHPECNGVVERMHGTLGPMLTKASQLGMDWVGQLPFALFALRSAPNKDSLFSPFQLVYGHRVRTPLDILHQGWAELSFSELDTGEWSDWLVDRLEVWHDILRERGKEASEKRKKLYDKGTVARTLEAGDQVLCRVPGMCGKLMESWHGPYVVEERKSKVDYRVKVGRG